MENIPPVEDQNAAAVPQQTVPVETQSQETTPHHGRRRRQGDPPTGGKHKASPTQASSLIQAVAPPPPNTVDVPAVSVSGVPQQPPPLQPTGVTPSTLFLFKTA